MRSRSLKKATVVASGTFLVTSSPANFSKEHLSFGLAAARRKRSAGSWTAVWQWAAIDGGSAAEGA